MSDRLSTVAGPSRRRATSLIAVTTGIVALSSIVGGSALAANADPGPSTTPTVGVVELGVSAQSSTFTVTNTAGKLVASNFTIGDVVTPVCPTGSVPFTAGLQYSLAGAATTVPAVSVSASPITVAGLNQTTGTLFRVKASLPAAVAQAALNKAVTVVATASCKSSSGEVFTGQGPAFQANTTAATKRGSFYVSNNGSVVSAKESAYGVAPSGQIARTSTVTSAVAGRTWKAFTSTKTAYTFRAQTYKGKKLTANASLVYAKGAAGKAGSNLVASTVWNGIASYTISTKRGSHTY